MPATTDFDATTFARVKAQILKELGYAESVRSYVESTIERSVISTITNNFTLNDINEDIDVDVNSEVQYVAKWSKLLQQTFTNTAQLVGTVDPAYKAAASTGRGCRELGRRRAVGRLRAAITAEEKLTYKQLERRLADVFTNTVTAAYDRAAVVGDDYGLLAATGEQIGLWGAPNIRVGNQTVNSLSYTQARANRGYAISVWQTLTPGVWRVNACNLDAIIPSSFCKTRPPYIVIDSPHSVMWMLALLHADQSPAKENLDQLFTLPAATCSHNFTSDCTLGVDFHDVLFRRGEWASLTCTGVCTTNPTGPEHARAAGAARAARAARAAGTPEAAEAPQGPHTAEAPEGARASEGARAPDATGAAVATAVERDGGAGYGAASSIARATRNITGSPQRGREHLHADRQPGIARRRTAPTWPGGRPGCSGSCTRRVRYIASGSAVFAPSSNATVGDVGASNTSNSRTPGRSRG